MILLFVFANFIVLDLEVMPEWGLGTVYSPALFDRTLNKFIVYLVIPVHLLELSSALLLPLRGNFLAQTRISLWTFLQPFHSLFQKYQFSVQGFQKLVLVVLKRDLGQRLARVDFGFWIGKELTFECRLSEVGLQAFWGCLFGPVVSQDDYALGLEPVFVVDGIRIFCFLNFHNFYSWI